VVVLLIVYVLLLDAGVLAAAASTHGRTPHSGWLLPYMTHDLQAIEQALAQTDL
jgi:hypothetical protein